jgi:hypothetical protein
MSTVCLNPLLSPFKGEFFSWGFNPSLEKRGRGDFGENVAAIIQRISDTPHYPLEMPSMLF